jgi:hypothetical protein
MTRIIFDPYEWMPGYGESGVSFHSSPGYDLVLEVTYDEPDSETREGVGLLRRQMTFRHAAYVIRAPFPGVDPLHPESANVIGLRSSVKAGATLPDERLAEIGSLIEIEDSDFLEGCKQVYGRISGHAPPAFRHFSINFLSENVRFQIIAVDVTLSEPVRVTSVYE